MDNQELLLAVQKIIQAEIAPIKAETASLRAEIHTKINELESKPQEVKPEIMDGVTVLLDTEFKRNYDLLGERLDEILIKMPSEDDMDIIDGRLAEHDSELKVLRHDVNGLKKAL